MRNPDKILIVRTDKIGDVVLSLPVVSEIKRVLPSSQISVLVDPNVRDIVESDPDIDNILYDKWKQDSVYGFKNLVSMIKRERFDAAILLHPDLRLAFALYAARISLRIGTGYRLYSFLFNKRIFEHRKKNGRHEAELNLSLAKALNPQIDTKRVVFNLKIDKKIFIRVKAKLKSKGFDEKTPFIIVHPGSKGSALTWPVERFSDLVKILSSSLAVQIFITGLTEEKNIVNKAAIKSEGVFNLAGLFDLKELMGLIKMSELVFANSTGPLHIAAALDTNVIGLYPPVAPMSVKRWGPYTEKKEIFTPAVKRECKRCIGEKCEFWNCMDMIKVQDVAAEAVLMLRKTGAVK